jgi:hypothetical protein
MPTDLALDDNFELFIDHTGDLATVSGRDEFEQRLRIRLTELYQDIISEFDKQTILSLVELEAERVADEAEEISSMPLFRTEFSETDMETLEVDIVYDTDETTFQVN